MERMDFAREQTFARVASEQPAWIFKKAVLNLGLLFSPDSYVLYKIRRGAYGELSAGTVLAVSAVVIASYAVVIIAGALGLATAGGAGRAGTMAAADRGVEVFMAVRFGGDVRR